MDTLSIPELREQIFSYFHPYHLLDFYLVCKDFKAMIDSIKYDLMKKLFPRQDINPRREIANLSIFDVAEVSLVLNPISESIRYYDRYTLFYYSCLSKQHAPWGFATHVDSTILWIAYKFHRTDVLEYFLNNSDPEGSLQRMECDRVNVMIAGLNIKLLRKTPTNIDKCAPVDMKLESSINLFSYKEIAEITLIFGGILKCDLVADFSSMKSNVVNNKDSIQAYIERCSGNYIHKLLTRYGFPHTYVERYGYRGNSGPYDDIENGIAHFMSEYWNTGGYIFAMTGEYYEYIRWKKEGNRVPQEVHLEESVFGRPSIGPSILGKKIANKDKIITSDLQIDMLEEL